MLHYHHGQALWFALLASMYILSCSIELYTSMHWRDLLLMSTNIAISICSGYAVALVIFQVRFNHHLNIFKMIIYFTPAQMLFTLFSVPNQAPVLTKLVSMSILNLFDGTMMFLVLNDDTE